MGSQNRRPRQPLRVTLNDLASTGSPARLRVAHRALALIATGTAEPEAIAQAALAELQATVAQQLRDAAATLTGGIGQEARMRSSALCRPIDPTVLGDLAWLRRSLPGPATRAAAIDRLAHVAPQTIEDLEGTLELLAAQDPDHEHAAHDEPATDQAPSDTPTAPNTPDTPDAADTPDTPDTPDAADIPDAAAVQELERAPDPEGQRPAALVTMVGAPEPVVLATPTPPPADAPVMVLDAAAPAAPQPAVTEPLIVSPAPAPVVAGPDDGPASRLLDAPVVVDLQALAVPQPAAPPDPAGP
ncbi:hypothetical protein GKE82_23660 [Conexibacter sp. W3-3-2]|uniref:hypothetical protein n=1 Tax=Conexibacter sp. W3-3-2 TaxID=2675227 RepID=UPI0012B7E08B|nr:hypothetical protein [Conexibacter sp. W3-3-2]MTD47203.1 hypothetical protein [Conexibacter sp. W3-3-2]